MREGWCYKKLGEVCEIRGGATPLRTNDAFWTNGNIPWFTIDDIREQGKYITFTNQMITEAAKEKLFTFPKGTIMLCCTASLGACSIAKIELTSNQQFNGLMIKNREELLEEYLYYFATTLTPILLSLSGKATINFVSRAKVEKIEIPIPPLATQQQIVSELDLLSHILDQKRQQLKEYDVLAESIFYDMFGDPVENPKGWEVKKLEEIVSSDCSISYGIVQPGDGVEEGVPVVRPVDLIDTYVYRTGLKQTTKEISNSYKRSILKGGEILMCVRGTTGLASLASQELAGCNVTRGIVPLSFDSEASTLFVFRAFKCKSLLNEIADKTNGIALKQINMKDLRQIELIFPPLSLQRSFAAKIESIEHQKQLLRASIKETEMLFQSRMDYWFNG